MAKYSKSHVYEEPLSDGSQITFIRPTHKHVNRATAAGFRAFADWQDARKAELTQAQRRELADAEQKQQAAPRQRRDPSHEEKLWARFSFCDHATLLMDCLKSWTDAGEDVVEDGDYEAVPESVLEEAARKVYETYVGRPEEARGN